MAGLSMEEDASCSPSGICEDIKATADIPLQQPSPRPVSDTVTDGPSMLSLGTEHNPPDAIAVEHTAICHTCSSDVEAPSSPSPSIPVLNDFLPIGMLLPLNSVVSLSEHASFFARISFSDASLHR